VVRVGGVDCLATYLHEPGDSKDGLTVEVPIFALNQVDAGRCEWLVPGMLKDKIQALLKSLPQRPRSRLVPIPHTAQSMAEVLSAQGTFGNGSLTDAVVRLVREKTQLDVKAVEFKADMLSPHLLMNIKVVDETGRQLGMGRQVATLKANLGGKARGAFQALAQLKLGTPPASQASANEQPSSPAAGELKGVGAPSASAVSSDTLVNSVPQWDAQTQHTEWSFGPLPELMEIRQGKQSMVGFPALVDQGDAVCVAVFDEPDVAARQHRMGLSRLCALQIKDALKYLEKNIPDLQMMSVAYMPLGTAEQLRAQIIAVAIDKAFLQAPLPTDADSFLERVKDGRGRLTLIANEVARTSGDVLVHFTKVQRKLRDSKALGPVCADVEQQLGRLMPTQFVRDTPSEQLAHLPRYLQAMVLRLDKARNEAARDALNTREVQRLEQAFYRLLSQRKGQVDDATKAFRWLLEELRVGLFAQELRTRQPVSVKRLEKALALLQA